MKDNIVAKNAYKYNKCIAYKDKKKEYQLGKQKHKDKSYESY